MTDISSDKSMFVYMCLRNYVFTKDCRYVSFDIETNQKFHVCYNQMIVNRKCKMVGVILKRKVVL